MKWKAAFFVSVALCLLHAVWGFLQLPPVIATHYGAGGQPDATGSRTAFFVVYVLSVSVTLLTFLIVGAIISRKPETVNMPNRDYWLSGENRQPTIAYNRCFLWQIGLLTNLLVLFVFHGWLAANLASRSLSPAALLIAVGSYTVLVFAMCIKFHLRFRKTG